MSKYKVNPYFFSAQIAAAEDPNRDRSRDFQIEDGCLVKYVGPGGDVTVPSGVRSIADRAFANSLLLTSIHIPDSVTELGRGIFQGCSSLSGIHIPGHLLEGMTPMGAMHIFTDEIMNYPSKVAGFVQEILNETEDFSEGFRNLFIRELTNPFDAVRWLRMCIRQNRSDWVQKILDLNENNSLNLDGCIEDAVVQGKAEIVTRLLRYQQAHRTASGFELTMSLK